ncbi:MAG: PSD1 domain-containing protein [Bryobacterales bacterium]|nr:PSD1 domain-containing protein [Bryobacterales bacterium]
MGWVLPFLLLILDFAADVKPVLAKRCLGCHGPQVALHGLRLDTRAGALKGGDSGAPALVAGKSADSLLIRYVSGQDKEIVMPPKGPRLSAAEIGILRRWIDEGASYDDIQEAPAASSAKPSEHWSFQPIRKPVPPTVRNAQWVRNPIDAFILAKLEAKDWQPSAAAAPQQLLRRVSLDLTGLPPTIEEQDAFARTGNWDALVEDLLNRPAYGERWGRHWLDLVRYAESNGYERDGTKPEAWRYRDYVISSFNKDKPFDRLIAEQLAGDEVDGANPETLIALGYNRLGPWDDEPADPAEDRFDQLDDIVSTTSQVFLGLTLGCARCHNHKFDPLTAQDYYSMVAIFNGLKRPQRGRTELTLPLAAEDEIAKEQQRDKRIAAELAKATLQFKVAGYVEPDVSENVSRWKRETPDLPRGYFLYEPGPAAPKTHLLVRGKAARPGPEVPPAVPAVLVKEQPLFPAPIGRTSLRRLALARWLAGPDNPLTARVIVNRVWQFHFGEGLVRTPSDFGKLGEKPTHPELLDWLAAWFIDNGWSFKKLHKLILASNTYRMSKANNAAYSGDDPENRLWWRFPYKRLEAEAIRDSMLSISGKLNRTMGGPSIYPEIPDAALAGSSDPDKIWKTSPEPDRNRRTVYAFLKRSMIVPMLEVLDLCDTARSTAQRMTTSVAPQALTLFNGQFVNAQAAALAGRLRLASGTEAGRVELAYRLALARKPTPAESRKAQAFLRTESLEQFARVILNLNEFVYPD